MRNRVRCGWGQWGLVEAPLRALRYAFDQNFVSDYFYLLSEYCRPVRPLKKLREYLAEHDGTDFIECEGPEWIKGGIRADRYLYRYYFDKREHPKLHRWIYLVQKKLGLKRVPPKTYEVRFGSQWWCLSASTASNIFHELKNNHEYRKLKTAWIPDECFFQTVVNNSLSFCRNKRGSLTYVDFKDTGKPAEISKIHNIPEKYFLQENLLAKSKKVNEECTVFRDYDPDEESHTLIVYPLQKASSVPCKSNLAAILKSSF